MPDQAADNNEQSLPDILDASSEPPSPFLSLGKYVEMKKNRARLLAKLKRAFERSNRIDGDDISSSDDEVLLERGTYSPPPPDRIIKDDDEMSLSSLSSTEEGKVKPEEGETVGAGLNMASLQEQQSNYLYPNQYYEYMAYNGYIPGLGQFMAPASGSTTLTTANGGHYYQAPVGVAGHYYQHNSVNRKDSKFQNSFEQQVDPYSSSITKILDRVAEELKQILKRDFNKRMIETTAFKKYESWWDDQERDKNSNKMNQLNAAVSTESKSKAPDINQLLNVVVPLVTAATTVAAVEPDQYAMGLGLRATIPKLPSFRRVRKAPSPVRVDADDDDDSGKHLSDQEEMVQGSDEEETEMEAQQKKIQMDQTRISAQEQLRKRRPSVSSFFTTSSEESSPSESDSISDSELSDVEMAEGQSQQRKVLTHKREKRLVDLEDSDSEGPGIVERAKTGHVKMKTYGIYSDTESEDEVAIQKSEKDEEQAIKKTVRNNDLIDKDVSDISSSPNAMPRTPGRDDEEEEEEQKDVVKEKDEVSIEAAIKAPKRTYDYNRVYSDSEEEREYQEKRRRNTEYMEQIEREFKEEQLKKRDEEAQKRLTIDLELAMEDSKMETSLFDPLTPSLSTVVPETPGHNLFEKDPFGLPETADASVVTTDVKKDVNGFGKVEAALEVKEAVTVPALAKKEPIVSAESRQLAQIMEEHCYGLPPSAENNVDMQNELKARQSTAFVHDHGYTINEPVAASKVIATELVEKAPPKVAKREKEGKENKQKQRLLKKEQQLLLLEQFQYERLARERELKADKFVPKMKYGERDARVELMLLYEFLTKGIDAEDIEYLRRSHETLLQDDKNSYWLNATHWVDHCTTNRAWVVLSPPSKKRKRDNQVLEDGKRHLSGSARTEGFYKVDIREKMRHKMSSMKNNPKGNAGLGDISHAADINKAIAAKMQGISREARSNQRRLLTAFGASTESELLKFNQLKFRKKQIRFAKSGIHDWGLFAMESIAADEMVIEYVGQMVRPSVADLRETKYESIGIGSSYLFRIDLETIIDATKCGNLARFINHSCNVSIQRYAFRLMRIKSYFHVDPAPV